MGPQNAAKNSHQLYGGGTYTPSERAAAAVSSANGKGGMVDGKSIGNKGVDSDRGDTSATTKNNGSTDAGTGGTPPSMKQQASARYNQPSGNKVSDEKA